MVAPNPYTRVTSGRAHVFTKRSPRIHSSWHSHEGSRDPAFGNRAGFSFWRMTCRRLVHRGEFRTKHN
jgi:hypothetical protein